jgi:hypothetical protein
MGSIDASNPLRGTPADEQRYGHFETFEVRSPVCSWPGGTVNSADPIASGRLLRSIRVAALHLQILSP